MGDVPKQWSRPVVVHHIHTLAVLPTLQRRINWRQRDFLHAATNEAVTATIPFPFWARPSSLEPGLWAVDDAASSSFRASVGMADAHCGSGGTDATEASHFLAIAAQSAPVLEDAVSDSGSFSCSPHLGDFGRAKPPLAWPGLKVRATRSLVCVKHWRLRFLAVTWSLVSLQGPNSSIGLNEEAHLLISTRSLVAGGPYVNPSRSAAPRSTSSWAIPNAPNQSS